MSSLAEVAARYEATFNNAGGHTTPAPTTNAATAAAAVAPTPHAYAAPSNAHAHYAALHYAPHHPYPAGYAGYSTHPQGSYSQAQVQQYAAAYPQQQQHSTYSQAHPLPHQPYTHTMHNNYQHNDAHAHPPPPPTTYGFSTQQQQQQQQQQQHYQQYQQHYPPASVPAVAPSSYPLSSHAPSPSVHSAPHAAAAASSLAFRRGTAKIFLPNLTSSFVKAAEPDPTSTAAPIAPSIAAPVGSDAVAPRKSRWAQTAAVGVPAAPIAAAPAFAAYNPQQALSSAAPAAAPAAAPTAGAMDAAFFSQHPGLLEYVERSLAASPVHLKAAVEAHLHELLTSLQAGTRPGGTLWVQEPSAHMHVLGAQAQKNAAAAKQTALAKAMAVAQALSGKLSHAGAVTGANGGAANKGKAAAAGHSAHANGWTSGNNEPLGQRRAYADAAADTDSAADSDTPDFIPVKAHVGKGKKNKRQHAQANNNGSPSGGGGQPPAGKKARRAAAASMDPVEQAKVADRANRFRSYNEGLLATAHEGARNPIQRNTFLPSSSVDVDVDLDWSSLRISGTCQRLEKRYLRLTQAPLAEDVRPADVLERALDMVLDKWNSNPKDDPTGALHLHDYPWACDQLKSIRQDLTVQHLISSALCVRAYEEHARIALCVGDYSEYNQCQTQLKNLYADHAHLRSNAAEFATYRILYFLISENRSALNAMMRDEQAARDKDHIEQQQQAARTGASAPPPRAPLLAPVRAVVSAPSADPISLAFAVSIAALSDDYYTFFRLYPRLPFAGAPFLLRSYASSLRHRALEGLLRAYRPGKVSARALLAMLAFDSEAEGQAFLTARNLAWTDAGLIDANTAQLQQPTTDSDDAASTSHMHGVTHAIFATS